MTIAQKKLSSCIPTPGEGEAIIYRHKLSSASTTASPTTAVRTRLLGDAAVQGTSLSSSMMSLTVTQSPLKRPFVEAVLTSEESAGVREDNVLDDFL
jgi:hypothetical protein